MPTPHCFLLEEWRAYHEAYDQWCEEEADFESELRDLEDTLKCLRVEWSKRSHQRERDLVTLYAETRNTISEHSISEMAKSASFVEIEEKSQLTELLLLAREVHSLSTTADRFADCGDLFLRFNTIRQRADEPLYEYWRRFKDLRERCEKAAEGTGCGFVTDPFMGYLFLQSLQKGNVVVQFMAQTSNAVKQSGDPSKWPQSVDAAYEAINTFKVVVGGGGSTLGIADLESSFAALNDKPHVDKPRGGKHKEKGGKGGKNGKGGGKPQTPPGGSGKVKQDEATPGKKLPHREWCSVCLSHSNPGQMHWQSD